MEFGVELLTAVSQLKWVEFRCVVPYSEFNSSYCYETMERYGFVFKKTIVVASRSYLSV